MPTKRAVRKIVPCEPRLVTHCQVYSYQVFFQENGRLRSIDVTADTPGEAIGLIADCGYQVTKVGTGVPILDPARELFDRTSAAAFVGCSLKHIDDLQTLGLLSKKGHGKTGDPHWRKSELEEAALAHMEKSKQREAA